MPPSARRYESPARRASRSARPGVAAATGRRPSAATPRRAPASAGRPPRAATRKPPAAKPIDAAAAVAARDQLVEPGRRLVEPPVARQECGRETAEVVVVRREPGAGNEVRDRSERADRDRDHAVGDRHVTRTR